MSKWLNGIIVFNFVAQSLLEIIMLDSNLKSYYVYNEYGKQMLQQFLEGRIKFNVISYSLKLYFLSAL